MYAEFDVSSAFSFYPDKKIYKNRPDSDKFLKSSLLS